MFVIVTTAATLHTSGSDQVTNVVDEQDVLLYTQHAQGKEDRMIMIITEDKRMMLLQDGNEVFNMTLTHMQVPEISAIYGTAKMEVINNTAYIGGFNGTVYELHVTIDAAGNVSVNISTLSLNLPGTTEVFASNGSNVIAACFDNSASTLYIVNVHSPAERSQLKFMSVSDLSNIVVVDNVFYFVQSDKLFRGDTSNQRRVENLQDCIQPWLIRHKNHFIIIHCQGKSIVFLPHEWSSVPGIWKGAWEDEKPYPCYGIGTAPLIFTSNRTAITLYDIRNDFQKTIQLNGTANVETITCAWSNNNLTVVYKESQCDCWIMDTLDDKLEYKNSTPIPFASGMLHPLSTSRGDIDQSVLIFYSNVLHYLLLPSAVQTLVDMKTGFAYNHITSNVVLYHGMMEFSREDNGNTGKNEPNDKSFEESHSWTVPLVVGITVLIISIVVLGLVSYRIWQRRRRNGIIEG